MSFFARVWLKAAPAGDKRGARRHRERLVAGLSGTVVEVGAGAGLNFPLYPPEVTRVLALEPEPLLRMAAEKAAGPRVEVRDGLAEAIPLGDAEADAVVFALVLCTVPDQAAALAEARRVLRPGGELRFYEHVIADAGPGRLALQALDHSGAWPAIGGGCHPARDTLGAIERAGFAVADHERFTFRAGGIAPLPHILGRAEARPG